jgi:hypothetical protein
MKTLIFFLIILIAVPATAKPKNNLPFAPKHKYGQLRTKQNKPVKQKVAYCHKQWGHN